MGSLEGEAERIAEGPWAETQHPVVLTRGFWLADTACTQALWQAVMGENPSEFRGERRPVDQVTWDDVQRFIERLNGEIPGLSARLPTEAEWEYACRAGTRTPFSFGEDINPEQVNYNGHYPYRGSKKGLYRGKTVDVATLPANPWGLYEMHGNVWEWCADWLGEDPKNAVVDSQGPLEGRERMLRGGSWHNFGRYCRSACRIGYEPGYRDDDFGFRLARGLLDRSEGQPESVGAAGGAAGDGASAATSASPREGVTRLLPPTAGASPDATTNTG